MPLADLAGLLACAGDSTLSAICAPRSPLARHCPAPERDKPLRLFYRVIAAASELTMTVER